jgi:methylmalonyl-CoA mutase cobalamin-binding domain/chain
MEILFKGIRMADVSTSMTINAPAAMLLAFYIAVAEKQGARPADLRGTIQADILKEYIAQKEWIYPPHPSMRIITDMFEYCTNEMPQWNPISVSGYHIREAGSTAVQELAFTLANGFAYVEAGIAKGLDVDAFAPRLSFFFNSHLDFSRRSRSTAPRAEFMQSACATNTARRIRARGPFAFTHRQRGARSLRSSRKIILSAPPIRRSRESLAAPNRFTRIRWTKHLPSRRKRR